MSSSEHIIQKYWDISFSEQDKGSRFDSFCNVKEPGKKERFSQENKKINEVQCNLT
jgi:hypothetical protein